MTSDFSQLDLTKKYTYKDYLSWSFQDRVELIRGKIFKMSPAPNLKHQEVSGQLHGFLWNFLKSGKSCKVFHAPFDVRLPLPNSTGKPDTVVQPDIVVVCDESKLDEQGCNGAPDLVVEILSPGNTKKELKYKMEIYQSAGIPEYWVVDPDHEFVIIYHLDENGKYTSGAPFTEEDSIQSKVLQGLHLPVAELFKTIK